MPTCIHGLQVNEDVVPIAEECQQCDWCRWCEAVRQFNGELCATCGWQWGTEPVNQGGQR